jgi:hypothetical protein
MSLKLDTHVYIYILFYDALNHEPKIDGHVCLPRVLLLCAVIYTDFCPKQAARQLILRSPLTGVIGVSDCGLIDSSKYFNSKYHS